VGDAHLGSSKRKLLAPILNDQALNAWQLGSAPFSFRRPGVDPASTVFEKDAAEEQNNDADETHKAWTRERRATKRK
jgi:hypothetical protein